MSRTREPQYEVYLELEARKGFSTFGLMSNYSWNQDPKRVVFQMARYKFVSKLFGGMEQVLEVGCADGFCSRIVRREVSRLVVSDFDPLFIAEATRLNDPDHPWEPLLHDILAAPVPERFDGIYALDVFEHIPPEQSGIFLDHLVASLKPDGAVILGVPSLQSQEYASPESKQGHVNCMDGEQLRRTLRGWFGRVFLFSMNDEVVHTGFYPMAHYLLALCCLPRSS